MIADEIELKRISNLLGPDVAPISTSGSQVMIVPEALVSTGPRAFRCSMTWARYFVTSLGRPNESDSYIMFEPESGSITIHIDPTVAGERLLVEFNGQFDDQVSQIVWNAALDPNSPASGVASLDPNFANPAPPAPQSFPNYFFTTQAFGPATAPDRMIEIRLVCNRRGAVAPPNGFSIQAIKITGFQ
jgi:hypothetical protein